MEAGTATQRLGGLVSVPPAWHGEALGLVGRFGWLGLYSYVSSLPSTAPVGLKTPLHDETRLLTATELAVRLGVQPSWVNKAARANGIPHVRVGRYRRFRWPDIEAWLEGQRRGS